MSWPPESYQTLHSWPSAFGNFSKLSTEVGKAIKSPSFNTGNYEFMIIVYPGGQHTDSKDHVSVFLEMSKPSIVTRISYHLSIIDLNGNKQFSSNSLYSPFDVLGKKNVYGIQKFVHHTTLLEKLYSLPNDQLVILCEIANLNEPESLYSLERLGSYRKYLNNEQYSDMRIIVKSKTIHAHKVILTSGNEVFAAMFNHDTKESRENRIIIRDIEYDVMLELVRFIYFGQVQNIGKIVRKLLVASDKYGVSKLKAKCSEYLCRLLSNDNLLELLTFADRYNVEELKKQSITFFITHKKDIVELNGFEDTLKNMRANLLAEIITVLSSS